ncbi:hypothetical protein [Patulibacter sp. SYSU D01012]|uniref:hypothetical protein n=1 Tax=Patulibacter sp. SYSU D01012 TaxID=2817381 RepID=UPI001B3039E6|nr:hypothetical protein [Patulibacter sp. SYSU D01012]
MTKLLLSIHVVAAIVAIGPVTVAASAFPRAARAALADPHDQGAAATLASLHRICRAYAALGVLVPVFGLATAASLGVLGDAWLLASIGLTVVAAGVLALRVLPAQRRVMTRAWGATAGLDAPAARALTAPLAMTAGVFNLLWVAVTVLMIVRPGSTTGA